MYKLLATVYHKLVWMYESICTYTPSWWPVVLLHWCRSIIITPLILPIFGPISPRLSVYSVQSVCQRPSDISLVVNLFMISGPQPTTLPSVTSCSAPKVFYALSVSTLPNSSGNPAPCSPLTTLVFTPLELRRRPSGTVEAFRSESVTRLLPWERSSKCFQTAIGMSQVERRWKSLGARRSVVVAHMALLLNPPRLLPLAVSLHLRARERLPSASAWCASGPINLLRLRFATPYSPVGFLPHANVWADCNTNTEWNKKNKRWTQPFGG